MRVRLHVKVVSRCSLFLACTSEMCGLRPRPSARQAPRRLLRTLIRSVIVDLLTTDDVLTAANDTPIPASKRRNALVLFSVLGITFGVDILVSDQVNEFILGLDWLERNDASWHFAEGILRIGSLTVQLKRRPNVVACVRSIYVRETVEVPASTQVYLPVDLAYASLIAPRADWVMEARVMKNGLFAARTLLPFANDIAAIPFINVSAVKTEIKTKTMRCRFWKTEIKIH